MATENTENPYSGQEADTSAQEISNLTLGYLICPQDAANAFLGAVMITDFRTRPIHFSFASPVRPTVIQKILFGSTLTSHIKIDVIAHRLLSNIPQMPDVLFVDDAEILAAKHIIKKPTACLKKSTSHEGNPAKLSILDYATDSSNDQETVGQIIANLENVTDLIEPFTRMRQALKEALKSQEN